MSLTPYHLLVWLEGNRLAAPEHAHHCSKCGGWWSHLDEPCAEVIVYPCGDCLWEWSYTTDVNPEEA